MTKFSHFNQRRLTVSTDFSSPASVQQVYTIPTGRPQISAGMHKLEREAYLEDCKVMEDFSNAAFEYALNTPDVFTDLF